MYGRRQHDRAVSRDDTDDTWDEMIRQHRQQTKQHVQATEKEDEEPQSNPPSQAANMTSESESQLDHPVPHIKSGTSVKNAFDVIMAASRRASSCVSSAVVKSRNVPKVTRKLSECASAKQRGGSQKKLRQMALDVGQDNLGSTTCSICRMTYHKGDPDDDRDHERFHQKAVDGVRFPGWKTETVVDRSAHDGSRIIAINSIDFAAHKTKISEIFSAVDADLGEHRSVKDTLDRGTAYVLISKSKHVLGCLTVTSLQRAFRAVFSVTDNGVEKVDAAADEPVRAVRIGVEKIWVQEQARRTGIASRLLDAARANFIYGMVVPKQEIAFSQPTRDGVRLSRRYMGDLPLLCY